MAADFGRSVELAHVTGRTVFFTSLLNAKTVIVGLVLLRSGGSLWNGAQPSPC